MKRRLWFFLKTALFLLVVTMSTGCSLKKGFSKNQSYQVRGMEHMSSELRISTEELSKWDQIVQELDEKTPLKRNGDSYRLYTYLYYAQKVFATLSFKLTNVYSGSLDSISLFVVNLFYPEYKNTNVQVDAFSEKLTAVIGEKIKARFEREEKQLRPMPYEKNDAKWNEKNPVGVHFPNLEPWALRGRGEFKSLKPHSSEDPFWQKQLEQTKKHASKATAEEKYQGLFWARLVDPKTADWRYIGVNYMREKEIPLEMQLQARSDLMMALIDALIVVFRDKYTYLIKRPYMLDSELKTLFSTPNHPSYPAAHGTMSGAAEIILAYYFPENQKEWEKVSKNCRMSRLWGAVHFPVDLDEGEKQGRDVGKAVLFR